MSDAAGTSLLRRWFSVSPRADRWERIGLGGALLIYFSVGLLSLVTLPPYHPIDEGRHMGYAMALGEGRIPHVLDPIDTQKLQIETFRGTNIQAAAAHPPLYHALVAYPLKLAIARGDAAMGVRFARVLSLLFGGLTLVFAFRLLRRLAPERPHVAIAGVAFVGSLPVYVNACSIGYNDGLAVLAAVAALDASFGIVTRGFTWRRYLFCALWLCAASLTRLTCFLAAFGAVATVGLAPLLDRSASVPRRLLVGAARAFGLVALAVAASGWFYVRNYLTYGDITASSALLDRLNRQERGLFRAFFSWRWLDLFEHYWVRIVGGVNLWGTSLLFARALLIVAAISLVIVAVLRRHELRRAFVPSELMIMRAGALVLTLGTVIPVLLFFAKGGFLTPRYIMPASWVEFGVVALALSWTVRPWLTQGTVVLLGFMSFLTLEVYATKVFDDVPFAGGLSPRLKPDDFGIVVGLRSQGFPLPEYWFVVGLVAMVAGLMLVLHAVSASYLRAGLRRAAAGTPDEVNQAGGTSASVTS